MSKTFLFQTIQFNLSTQFSSICPINWTLSVATTLGQSGPWSNGNEEVLSIPQSSSIIGTSSSDGLVSYLGHSMEDGFTLLPSCSRFILPLQPVGQERHWCKVKHIQLEFELRTSIPFRTTTTMTLSPHQVYIYLNSSTMSRIPLLLGKV